METDQSRLLDALPGMVWTTRPDGTCDFVNRHWRDYTGLTLEQAMAAGWMSLFHPDDVATAIAAWEQTSAPTPPEEINVSARLRRFDGVYRRFHLQTRPLKDAAGNLIGWCGANTDIEDRTRAEAQLAAEKRLLELVARGLALPGVLNELCLLVESLSPGSYCSILFVDDDGDRFRVGAGPHLPADYNAALEGLKIDPEYGPCSLAVQSRSTIIAADPPRDPRWASSPWPQLVTGFGLASCWSAPIFDSRSEVLGIFAIYKHVPQGPSAEDEELIDRFARIAGIAIERARFDAALTANAAQLRRAHDHLAQAQQLSHTGSFTTDFASDSHVWSDELYRILEFDMGSPVSFETFRSLIHSDDHAMFSAGFQSTIKNGTDFDEVFRLTTPKGTAKYLHAVAKRLETGATTTFMGSIQDVTEAQLAEHALKAGEAELRRAHDRLAQAQRLSRTGSFMSDWARDEHVWSDELYRILEFEPGAAITFEGFRSRIHPHDQEAFLTGFQQALEGGQEFGLVFRWRTPKGNAKFLHAVAQRIEGASPAVSIGAIQDVTESKLAEEALKASEAGLRRANRYLAGAQRLSKTGSFTWDVATDEQDWSEELYRIWEMAPHDDRSVPTLHASVLHAEDVDPVEAIMGPALEAGADYEVSYRIVTPSGAIKHLHTVSERVQEITDRLVYVGATQDLTASRLAEEALRTSEAQLRRANRYLKAAQTLSRIGSFTWDIGSDELDWSDENYRIWEVDPAVTPTMDTILNAIHPDDLEMVAETIANGKRTGGDFDVFYRIVTASGVVKHLHTVSTRIPEITDRLLYIGSNQDVTENKLAEAALKASEAEALRANRFLKGAQTLSRIGSFTWDVEADTQDWSDESYRIWDFDPAVPPTMSMVLDVIHPEDLAVAGQAIAEGQRTGEDFEVFYRIVTKTGAVRHLHTVATRVPEIADRLVYIGSTQDVTASKRAEAELARANTYLLAAQRLSQTGSFTWDVEADEHNWSEVIYRIFGFEPGTRVTMDMMMRAIHPDDLPGVEALIGGAQIGENFELVFRVINTSGETRYAHVVGHRIDHIPERPVFMGALQDITARKLAEDDLNRAREDLAHVARVTALSTLTASIAHEVSQPLAGIITNSSTCLRMLAADPPDVTGALATAQRNLRDGNRASEVIKRLRALYARRPPTLEPVDLQEIAREVLALLASELQRRRVIVRTEFAAGLPVVAADRVQLQQVILNLILNAADAMGDVTDRVRDLRICTRGGPDGEVSLEIRDSGPGFAPEGADKLFQAFHTTKPDGMGIGLSVSRSIIEAHGGLLSAAPNDSGPGATFTFSVPCDPVQAAPSVLRQA